MVQLKNETNCPEETFPYEFKDVDAKPQMNYRLISKELHKTSPQSWKYLQLYSGLTPVVNEERMCEANLPEEMFPYEITDVDPVTTKEIKSVFTGNPNGYVVVGPEKYLFPVKYRASAPHFWNFQSRPDDVWVATFPRSGTTWMQELVWLITHDLNYKKSENIPLWQRFPTFEMDILWHDDYTRGVLEANANDPVKLELAKLASSDCHNYLPLVKERRFMKTHFAFSLLPPSVMRVGAKVVYVARNPKDVIVSYYHLNRIFMHETYTGDFPKFWDLFERNLLTWAPYWSHLREGWENRHHPNVLFLFYEDMIKDLRGVINKVATFLDKSLSAQEVDRLCSHLNIDNFKHNPSVNMSDITDLKMFHANEERFVRNGKNFAKGWQEEYTPEVIERVERWMEMNLAKTDMRFPE